MGKGIEMARRKQPVIVKQYIRSKDYEKEARKLAKQGYRVAHTVTEQPRSGCLRIIALGGIGALLWKPKNITTVTYELVT